MKLTKELIFEHLAPIVDPEIHIGLVDLGLIYDAEINEANDVKVTMTLTSPMCPVGPELVSAVELAVKSMDEVNKVTVDVTFDPPWDPEEMASDAAKDELGIW